jgi:hypothetical protein
VKIQVENLALRRIDSEKSQFIKEQELKICPSRDFFEKLSDLYTFSSFIAWVIDIDPSAVVNHNTNPSEELNQQFINLKYLKFYESIPRLFLQKKVLEFNLFLLL